MRPSPMGEGMNPPALDGICPLVWNNSMPPVASTPFGTSGCDYPSRNEFGKKHFANKEINRLVEDYDVVV